jgi:hypothetical protein
MAQQWRIGISGKQRKDVDVQLLVQAVIALGEQLRDEAAKQHQDAISKTAEPATKGGTS